MNLNTDIVKEIMKEAGMVPKCDLCDTEIKNEETEFLPIKLVEGKVRHVYYYECLQNNKELRARWHEANEKTNEQARQERLQRVREHEEQRRQNEWQ
jgi:CRISPR/Cas system CSM-associated protein Csm5 (group 7 of RAMP superfamily)